MAWLLPRSRTSFCFATVPWSLVGQPHCIPVWMKLRLIFATDIVFENNATSYSVYSHHATSPSIGRRDRSTTISEKWHWQDPVSTMQKTGWTNYSSLPVWKRVSPMDVVARGELTTIFLCIGPFSARWRTNNQPGDPRASLLLTRMRRQSLAIFDMVTNNNNQTNNRVILEQACSWPVRRQSFAKRVC